MPSKVDAAPAFTRKDLAIMQAYPFATKIGRTQTRLCEWYTAWNQQVYISFSGGKDSTVLADLAARICRVEGWELVLLFVDTGLEFPEIRKFVRFFAQWLRDTYGIAVRLEVRRPDESFSVVIQRKGYPFISKEVAHTLYGARMGWASCIRKLTGQKMDHNGERSKYNCEQWAYLRDTPFIIGAGCCDTMKKHPAERFEKETGLKMVTAEMAAESILRQTQWLSAGCNGFDLDRPKSTPMAFWLTQDVLRYLLEFKVPYVEVYGDIVDLSDQLCLFDDCQQLCTTGCDRTGCIFCGFGIFMEQKEGGENRFQRLKRTHPKQYAYCMAEPRIIHKRTGREMFRLHDFRMTIAFNMRRKYGDKYFDENFKVVGGLGYKAVLDYLKIAC